MIAGAKTVQAPQGKQGLRIVSKIELKVNGHSHTLDLEPDTPLLYILRNDLDLRGPHFGCGLGQCGSCPWTTSLSAVTSLSIAETPSNPSTF